MNHQKHLTVPRPVDRAEFRFVVVDTAGAERRCIGDDIVWVRLQGRTGGARLNESLSGSAECRLEKGHRAG